MKKLFTLFNMSGLSLLSPQVFAHTNASHNTMHHHSAETLSYFTNGLLHPLNSIDHILVLLAAGLLCYKLLDTQKNRTRTLYSLAIISFIMGSFLPVLFHGTPAELSASWTESLIFITIPLMLCMACYPGNINKIFMMITLCLFMLSQGWSHSSAMSHPSLALNLLFMTGLVCSSILLLGLSHQLCRYTLQYYRTRQDACS